MRKIEVLPEFELDVVRDCDLAYSYAEDVLNGANGDYVVKLYNRHDLSGLVIFESEDLAEQPQWKTWQLKAMRKHELWEIMGSLDKVRDQFWGFSFEQVKKYELVEALECVTREQYYQQVWDCHTWRDFNANYADACSCGYSQGDAVCLVFVGNVATSKEEIDQILWDTPVSGKIEVFTIKPHTARFDLHVGDLVYDRELVDTLWLYDYLDDCWNYDREEVIANFEERYNGAFKDELLAHLQKHLPETPEYSY